MKKAAVILATFLTCWVIAWQIAAHWPVPAPTPGTAVSTPPDLKNLAIAPRAEALTFARFPQGDGVHVLLVTRFADGKVTGFDLQALIPAGADDPIAIFNTLGYERLEKFTGVEVSVDADALVLPFTGTDNQIAVGINYPAHANEAAVVDSFLFPKRTLATPHRASVPARHYLLDYEIELGFVLLNDLRRDEVPEHLGLVLSSDYSDRAGLLRHANLRNVSSGDGFTQGKSEPGFMPTGNLLIIPKDYLSFYKGLTLELWYNGDRRQVAHPAGMIWDVRRMMSESFLREGRSWQWNGQLVTLPVKDGRIPARTVFLSGTPAGVIYRSPSPRQMFVGLSEVVFSGQWMQWQPAILEPFLREEYRSGRYMKAGDIVEMKADRLGTMTNRIVAE